MKSPLTLAENVILKKTILCEKIISNYYNTLNIDVSEFFQDVDSIQVYECLDTGYAFFYPFNIAGDGRFYENLQQFDWYYMPWKWEHEITKNILSGHEKILEVGSGGLGFVEKIRDSGYDVTGLELNQQSVSTAKDKGLKVLNESVEFHSVQNLNEYDIVCSFQVLEHISQVRPFLNAQVACLKTGGKLIISVPNNDSFVKFTEDGLLNIPPHHMGLWNKKSLLSLCSIFSLKVDKIYYEPLQDYHLDWYINSTIQKKIFKNKFTRVIFKKLKLRNLYSKVVRFCKTKIRGHSIVVVYTKI